MSATSSPEPAAVRPIGAATIRRLLVHEARVHAASGREVRDLGDAILLHDPADPEPFWNRLTAIRWPTAHDAFDHRLAEMLVLFASIARQPHVWPSPDHDTPVDLVPRLAANGFRDMGAGRVMVLTNPGPAVADRDRPRDPGITLERWSGLVGGSRAMEIADSLVPILFEAFDVDVSRRPSIRAETVASLADPRVAHYLARIDGQPAAVARRTTFDGASYLSSIGTLRTARGHGLGAVVTLAAAADAVAAGSEWTYLGVDAENETAIRLYRRSGFEVAGEALPDMLLIG